MPIDDKLWQSLKKLMDYAEREGFKGYDPYDALNSGGIRVISRNSKYLRIAFTQGMRRIPVNVRPLLGIGKGLNPKGLGLFLKGYVKLLKTTGDQVYRRRIDDLERWLLEVKSNGYSGSCWGYNFPWQNRYQLLPALTPTIVNTSFVCHGLLDAYELLGQTRYLETARSACDFIVHDLRVTHENGEELCLSYTPLDNSKVYNANLLGASLLARVYSFTGDEHLLGLARKMVNYVVRAQNRDGSWYYGAMETQNWIDIHHTGFVLESLYDCINATGDTRHLPALERGLDFFRQSFFLNGGRPKLWHNRDYPVDIHSVQAVVTLIKARPEESQELVEKLVRWMIDHFQDPSGYFYYQKTKYFTNRIPYMRWSQAWVFHALTTYHAYLQDTSSRC
jgi:rhamnogalacturonyl hydrolase YesR